MVLVGHHGVGLLYSIFYTRVSRHQGEGSTVVIPSMSSQRLDFLVANSYCPATSRPAFFGGKGVSKYYAWTIKHLKCKARGFRGENANGVGDFDHCAFLGFCPGTSRGEAPRRIAGRPLSPVPHLPIFHSARWKGKKAWESLTDFNNALVWPPSHAHTVQLEILKCHLLRMLNATVNDVILSFARNARSRTCNVWHTSTAGRFESPLEFGRTARMKGSRDKIRYFCCQFTLCFEHRDEPKDRFSSLWLIVL